MYVIPTSDDICLKKKKNIFSLKKLKILRPKVTEIFMDLCKRFCEYPLSTYNYERWKIVSSLVTIVLPSFGYTDWFYLPHETAR